MLCGKKQANRGIVNLVVRNRIQRKLVSADKIFFYTYGANNGRSHGAKGSRRGNKESEDSSEQHVGVKDQRFAK